MTIVHHPEGVGAVDEIDEGGMLVRLTREVDLDDLLLGLAQQFGDFLDEPTYIPGAIYQPEADVAWFRKQPCNCWDQHNWDMAFVQRDEKPVGSRARGAFLGVYFG